MLSDTERSTGMGARLNTLPAQEVKRRGVRAILDRLQSGPVHVLQRDRPAFVALAEEQFQALLDEAEEARLAASLTDLAEGRVRFASASELLAEIKPD
jgi:PHD/YefM family antitoxin component YafN of YafNO toxin-antitoxin module